MFDDSWAMLGRLCADKLGRTLLAEDRRSQPSTASLRSPHRPHRYAAATSSGTEVFTRALMGGLHLRATVGTAAQQMWPTRRIFLHDVSGRGINVSVRWRIHANPPAARPGVRVGEEGDTCEPSKPRQK
jgi:hypothetical protein